MTEVALLGAVVGLGLFLLVRAQAERVQRRAQLLVHRHERERRGREIGRIVPGGHDVHQGSIRRPCIEARARPRGRAGGDARPRDRHARPRVTAPGHAQELHREGALTTDRVEPRRAHPPQALRPCYW